LLTLFQGSDYSRRSSSVARSKKLPPPAGENTKTSLEVATGTEFACLQQWLLHQTLATLWLPSSLDQEEKRIRINAAVDVLQEIKPQDAVEGMLAVQMVALHNAALECLRRAALPNQTPKCFDMNLRHAQRLTAGYLRQMEALDKRRGKGQQTLVVKYVNVEPGGQAVVGTVHTGQLPRPSMADVGASVEPVAQQDGEPLAVSQQRAVTRSQRKRTRDE
jgi:hypothetical protein